MKKTVIVFDFDGVLTVGGEGLKQEAWNILTLPFHDDITAILFKKMEKLSDGKSSRYDILQATFEKFFARDAILLTTAYAECYNTIVQKFLEQSGMPKGTEQVLAKLAQTCTLFVNSATPERSVRESVQNFGIAQYFRAIFGQPATKFENLRRATMLARVDKELMLFVGDSEGDRKAAKEFGCAFIGVANEWNKWRTKHDESRPSVLIDSIVELPALLAG